MNGFTSIHFSVSPVGLSAPKRDHSPYAAGLAEAFCCMNKDIPGYEGEYSVSTDGKVYSHKSGIELKQYRNDYGYMIVRLSKLGKTKLWRVHKLMAITFLVKPKGFRVCVDHINRVRSDNRIENIRWVTSTGNGLNAGISKNNKSGRTGVWHDWNRKRWCSSIMLNNKTIHLGRFKKKEDAVIARLNAENEYWNNYNKLTTT